MLVNFYLFPQIRPVLLNFKTGVVQMSDMLMHNCRTANGRFQKSEMYVVCFIDSDAVRKQGHRSYIQLVQQFVHQS